MDTVEMHHLPALGHSTANCPTIKKSIKPPVKVFVQKPMEVPPIPPNRRREEVVAEFPTSRKGESGEDVVEDNGGRTSCSSNDKAPYLLSMISIACWNVRGLNRRDHQMAVCDLIREFDIKFIGLLETRVATHNISQIQSFMLHGWNWFVDPNEVGNRIWLAWDVSEVVVDIISVHEQYIHCRIICLRAHYDFLVTVAYGLNDVVPRRALWSQLVTIMEDVGEEPWLVLGISIRFLITVRGGFFVAQLSDGPRSLWKKLDRILANDRWFARWPNSSYLCATPRTSDHSPLVLRGSQARTVGRCFRFDNYLAKSPGFIDLVKGVWEHHIVGTPMYSITRKLKALKPKFRQLRKEKGISLLMLSRLKHFCKQSSSFWRRITAMTYCFSLTEWLDWFWLKQQN
ncbi:UNVERIFIED_CONTAM: hypothetical protein Slati_0893900 [Sesamum latifolium]|uniref:Endonuclease/exonuclease/phosphatase n=1 Tax=Sesamum latifolium TaxID=2727402 RepID=A0AAW2XN44_9LAMI